MTAISVQFGKILLELTPLQRWKAITNPQNNPADSRWLLIIGLFLVAVLTAMLIYIIHHRKRETEESSPQLFDEYAQARNLTDREYHILLTLATNAELIRPELIFKLPSAFNRESSRLLKKTHSEQSLSDSQQLQAELAIICQKLGFRLQHLTQLIPATDTEGQSTRQIPVNKKFFIRSNAQGKRFDLEATVIKNTAAGLTVQLNNPVEIVFGQSWTCRYFAGAFVAEFKTTVSKCSGQFVMLAHSDQVRQINRRRFQRVPIRKDAYVAIFPFKKDPTLQERLPRKKVNQVKPEPNRTDQGLELPCFEAAVVTELGGPGLKIETALTLNVGERILVIFKLDTSTKAAHGFRRHTNAEMIIEHIARVRHITKRKTDFSVALELIGLHDEGLDELIQATNRASVKAKKSQTDTETFEVQDIWTEELVSV